jgi:hypothetical protein
MYNIPIVLQLNEVFIDAGTYSELGKVIRCNIKLGSVERSKDD